MSRIAAWCGLAVVLVLGPTLARGQSPDLGRAAPLDIPDVVLVDHNGTSHRVVRDLIRGKIAVVSFVFTGCTTICSPVGATMGAPTGEQIVAQPVNTKLTTAILPRIRSRDRKSVV